MILYRAGKKFYRDAVTAKKQTRLDLKKGETLVVMKCVTDPTLSGKEVTVRIANGETPWSETPVATIKGRAKKSPGGPAPVGGPTDENQEWTYPSNPAKNKGFKMSPVGTNPIDEVIKW